MSGLSEIKAKSTLADALFELVEKMYPICRSITGDGVRSTLAMISELIPITTVEVPSGTQILDWKVPLEWNIKDAWIKNSNGKKIIDFNDCNLHVLNYSMPINKKVNLTELKKHLFTLKEQPDLIPYRTSYHHEEWGFCMSHKQFNTLGDEMYEVMIDTSLIEGNLTYGELLIPGILNDEILITTHICHPSLANDNLSSIAVATYLAKHLKELEGKTTYSYRFLFIPATVGSISWLSKNENNLSNIKHGLVLSLLGDEGSFNYKKSRQGNAEIDLIMAFCLKELDQNFGILDFSPYGYDERQFCSPGYNLPVGRLSRALHGEFPEYHTSADNLNFIKGDKLFESLQFLISVIKVIEHNNSYINLSPKGEPQLGRRGLFKNIGGQKDAKDFQMALLWVLNQSDGNNSLIDIASKAKLSFSLILHAAQELVKVDLLKLKE